SRPHEGILLEKTSRHRARRCVMVREVPSRVFQLAPVLLALALPTVLEAQKITPTFQFNPSSVSPGSKIDAVVTYAVPSPCQGLNTFFAFLTKDQSGTPFGQPTFKSSAPASAVSTPQGNALLLNFPTGVPDGEVVTVTLSIPTNVTQATLASGVTIGSTGPSTCGNPSISATVPISAPTSGANLLITKTAFGAGGQILEGGT